MHALKYNFLNLLHHVLLNLTSKNMHRYDRNFSAFQPIFRSLSPGIHSVDPNLWTVPMHLPQPGEIRSITFSYLFRRIRTRDDGVTGLLLDYLITWPNINIWLSVTMSNILDIEIIWKSVARVRLKRNETISTIEFFLD